MSISVWHFILLKIDIGGTNSNEEALSCAGGCGWFGNVNHKAEGSKPLSSVLQWSPLDFMPPGPHLKYFY